MLKTIFSHKDPIQIKTLVSKLFLLLLLVSSCKDSGENGQLSPSQITSINQFVDELNKSLDNFEFDFIKTAWSHSIFKRRIGKLGNIGHGVFDHIYETTVKSSILRFNLDLINKVKHSGGILRYIKTNISDGYAEVTYLLIDEGYYSFIKYRIDIENERPYLTDIYSFKEDQWFSNSMRQVVLLNTKHTALSPKRHQANRALSDYQMAMNDGNYEYAFDVLNQVPESHQIFNDFKIARINTAAQLGDSILRKTIELENDLNDGNNIYVDYLMAFYLNDSTYRNDVDRRMQFEIGIPKILLDSLKSNNLIWN